MVDALGHLVDPQAYAARYGVPTSSTDVLLYAMGDGNHSFATAKLHWERVKEKATVRLQSCSTASDVCIAFLSSLVHPFGKFDQKLP